MSIEMHSEFSSPPASAMLVAPPHFLPLLPLGASFGGAEGDDDAMIDMSGAGEDLQQQAQLIQPGAYRSTLFAQQIRGTKCEAPAAAPRPRFGHTAVVYQNSMIIFAGRDSRCFGDLWMYSFTDRRWTEIAQPQDDNHRPIPRAGHTAAVVGSQMFIFGGVGDHANSGTHSLWLNDLWSFDLNSLVWRRIHFGPGQRMPDRRKGHTAQVFGGRMYVYGGGQDDHTMFSDLWEFNPALEEWIERRHDGYQPQARMYHVSAVTPSGRLLVFGGRAQTQSGFLNDVFQVDLHSFNCVKLDPAGTPPTHRMCSTAIYHNNVLAIFTGGSFAYLEDSFQLDLRSMRWEKLEAVSLGGRTRPTTVKWQNTVLTFGGCVHGNGYVNDFVEVELEPMSLVQCVSDYIQEMGLADEVHAEPIPTRLRDMLRPPPVASAP
eukprot:Hpha_TRINITY_DN16578_c0_g3::TRINITY_DN16578_c0_g3_i1::g.136062::m.136062